MALQEGVEFCHNLVQHVTLHILRKQFLATRARNCFRKIVSFIEITEFSIFPFAGPGHVHAPGSIPAAAISRPPGGTDRHRGRSAKPAAGRSQRPPLPKRRRRISSESFTLRRIQRSSTSACEARGIRHPGTVSRTRSESM